MLAGHRQDEKKEVFYALKVEMQHHSNLSYKRNLRYDTSQISYQSVSRTDKTSQNIT